MSRHKSISDVSTLQVTIYHVNGQGQKLEEVEHFASATLSIDSSAQTLTFGNGSFFAWNQTEGLYQGLYNGARMRFNPDFSERLLEPAYIPFSPRAGTTMYRAYISNSSAISQNFTVEALQEVEKVNRLVFTYTYKNKEQEGEYLAKIRYIPITVKLTPKGDGIAILDDGRFFTVHLLMGELRLYPFDREIQKHLENLEVKFQYTSHLDH